MRSLQQLQFDLGEGPTLDAHRDGAPVLVPDLAAAATQSRWPVFAPAAIYVGAKAMFCAPLRQGAVRVGALTCWRERPGALDDDGHADLLVLAEVATRLVLDLEVGSTGGVATVQEVDFDSVVHQAVGMVSEQLGVPLDTALVRLRAHAFAAGRSVAEVSADVVDRRLRLEEGPGDGGL